MRLINSNILVELYGTGDIISFGQLKLFLDPAFVGYQHAPIVGKVLKKADELGTMSTNIIVKEYDIREGDEVLLSRGAAVKAAETYEKRENGNIQIFIKPNDIVAIKRNDDVYPINGHIFVEILPPPKQSELEVIEAKKEKWTRGKVLFIAKDIERYAFSGYTTEAQEKTNVGDIILFPRYAHSPVENPLQLKFFTHEVRYLPSSQCIGKISVSV